MTTLNEQSKNVLGRIINKEQGRLELQAANRMSNFRQDLDRLVEELTSLRDCRSYLVGEGLEVAVVTGKRAKEASKARTNLRSAATRFEKSDLSVEELISTVDGDTARQAIAAVEGLRDSLLKLIETCLNTERERLAPEEAYDDLPDVPGNTRLVHSLEQAKARLTSPVSLAVGDIRNGSDAIRDRLALLKEKAEVWSTNYPKLAAALAAASPEMQTFIKAASTEDGAPLSLLTDAVRAELEAADQLDGYRVRAR